MITMETMMLLINMTAATTSEKEALRCNVIQCKVVGVIKGQKCPEVKATVLLC